MTQHADGGTSKYKELWYLALKMLEVENTFRQAMEEPVTALEEWNPRWTSRLHIQTQTILREPVIRKIFPLKPQ